MPLVQTRGAASAQGFGEFAQAVDRIYVEEVFSTFLYRGNSSTQTITTGIDLSTKGGLLWVKNRTGGVLDHYLYDTVRGGNKYLGSNTTAAQSGANASDLTGITSTGFTLGFVGNDINNINKTYVSWTFREQPKFFDVVTYTGNGTAGRTVAHDLGSVPGVMIVKRTSAADPWRVYHRSLGNTQHINLDTNEAASAGSPYWNSTTPTSTVFTLGSNADVNGSGSTYVAYLFAHDAGGFGLSGTDNVISCGSFTVSAGGTASVTLGYEPQWVMVKASSRVLDWTIQDTMRGMYGTTALSPQDLYPNSSATEANGNQAPVNATGFTWTGYANETFIYVAIRRGPMKVPTLGTSVYNAIARNGNSTSTSITGVGFVPDLTSVSTRTPSGGQGFIWQDRLRGATRPMFPSITQVETTYANEVTAINQDGITVGTDTPVNQTGYTYINHFFGRAPGFFDEVCYSGDGVAGRSVPHNLAAVPELMIVKGRNIARGWFVYSAALGGTKYLRVNTTDAAAVDNGPWNSTTQTSSTVFVLGADFDVNQTTYTYVNYLFATCAGVSKVGSYTGNGTTQTINCGFGAGGARFVLIKRTDSTGNWYVYDSTRGMTVLTDPYLWLNDVVAEVATLGSVTAVSTGFALDAAIVAAINTNAASYIFLAIA